MAKTRLRFGICGRANGADGRVNLMAAAVFVAAVAAIFTACSHRVEDPKKYLPADSLIVVATDNLGVAIRPAIRNAAKQAGYDKEPDISNLEGVKVAAAITGFEAKELPADGDRSVVNLRPKIVAIIELNRWSWETGKIVENGIGEMINQAYGGEVVLESVPKADGRYYTWTAQDGRRVFAFTVGSLVFLANDEAALEKALAVRNGGEAGLTFNTTGEADEKETGESRVEVARGLITEDGIAQLSNLFAIQMAIGSGEDEESRQFISAALPAIVRNAVKQVEWTTLDDGAGYEDRFSISLEPKLSEIFAGTLSAGDHNPQSVAVLIPADAASVTFYNLKDTRIAWRSVLLAVQAVSDPLTARLAPTFSGTLFEPYGIADPEAFLAAAGNRIATFRADSDGEQAAAVGEGSDIAALRKTLEKELAEAKNIEKTGIYTIARAGDYCFASSEDGRFAVGDCVAVDKAVGAATNGGNFAGAAAIREVSNLVGAAAVTMSSRPADPVNLLSIVGIRVAEGKRFTEKTLTQTAFNRKGVQRIVRSDFGLPGWLFEQADGQDAQ